MAQAVREKYPERPVIICADNDRQTSGNPGRTKALEAAKAVGGRVALATFPDGVDGTDFNDLHHACDLEEVRRQLTCQDISAGF